MLPRKKEKRIGQILLEAEVVTEDELNHGLEIQKANGERLGKNLVALGYIDEEKVTQYIAEQYKIPCISLDRYKLNKSILKIIPGDISETYGIVPLDLIGNILTVGIVEVPDEKTLRWIEDLTGFKIHIILISADDFNRYIQRVYALSIVDSEGVFDDAEVKRYVDIPAYEGRERRRFPRVTTKLKIKYEIRNEYNINSTMNISQGGALIRSKSPVPVDSHLLVRVELPTTHEDVIILSRVVRVERMPDENTYQIALCFSIMDARDSSKLARYIQALRNNK